MQSSGTSITFTSNSTRPSFSSISSIRPCLVPTTRMREYTERSWILSSSCRSTNDPSTRAGFVATIRESTPPRSRSLVEASSRNDRLCEKDRLCGENADGDEWCSDTKEPCSGSAPSVALLSRSDTCICTANCVAPMKEMPSCTASDHLRAIQSRFHSSMTPCSLPVNRNGFVSEHDATAGSSSRRVACPVSACSPKHLRGSRR